MCVCVCVCVIHIQSLCIHLCHSLCANFYREKPLAAYVFTEDQALLHRVTRTTSAGGVVHNDTLLQYSGDLHLHVHAYMAV